MKEHNRRFFLFVSAKIINFEHKIQPQRNENALLFCSFLAININYEQNQQSQTNKNALKHEKNTFFKVHLRKDHYTSVKPKEKEAKYYEEKGDNNCGGFNAFSFAGSVRRGK